jgi:hypothetical protein
MTMVALNAVHQPKLALVFVLLSRKTAFKRWKKQKLGISEAQKLRENGAQPRDRGPGID